MQSPILWFEGEVLEAKRTSPPLSEIGGGLLEAKGTFPPHYLRQKAAFLRQNYSLIGIIDILPIILLLVLKSEPPPFRWQKLVLCQFCVKNLRSPPPRFLDLLDL